MKTIKVLSEKNEYTDGKRIFTVCNETTSSLSDDIAELSRFYATLSMHQSTIESLRSSAPKNETEARPFYDEIARLTAEIDVLNQAIEIQNGYIKGFEENAL